MYIVRTQPGGEGGSGHSYKLYYCTGGGGGQKRQKTCVRTMYTAPYRVLVCKSLPCSGPIPVLLMELLMLESPVQPVYVVGPLQVWPLTHFYYTLIKVSDFT